MEDFLESVVQEKDQPMVDFNYNNQKANGARKSIFQIFTPKNSKNVMNNNPKDLFNANNKINSILSKNLKSIFKENKDDLPKNTHVFKDLNCLIKKSMDSNKYLYNQFLNLKNTSFHNNIYEPEFDSHQSSFQKTAIVKKNSKLRGNTILRKSIKKTIDVGKKVTFFDEKYKKEDQFNDKRECKTPTNRSTKIKPILLNSRKRNSSSLNNIKFNLNKHQINYKTDSLKRKSNESNSFFKFNELNAKKRRSSGFSSQFKRKRKSSFLDRDKKIFNPSYIGNMNKRRSSNLKNIYKLNNKIKFSRYSFHNNSPEKNMKIPTLKQINNAITKTFIGDRIGKVKKELNDLQENEVAQIISKLPQTKIYKKKQVTQLEQINLSQLINSKHTDHKELSQYISQTENTIQLDNDNFHKKYRKLYLCKNLYDSLDDEEIADQDKIRTLFILPNSFKAYIIDFFVLIASITELYYLPLYISLHMSSYAVYNNVISSIIFYIIDFIYIVDLITGFFRSFYNYEEMLVIHKSKMAKNYLSGWFFLDLIEAIPFFTLLNNNMKKSINNFISTNKDDKNMFDFGLTNTYFSLTVIKCLKIFKVFTLNRLFHKINKYLDKLSFFYEWKGLLSSIFVSFSALHFCTCFFIFLGKNEFGGWIVQKNLQNSSFGDLYTASLYYQMTTLTTVGYGDISAYIGIEKFYGIFILIVGTCAYSWILTYISNYIKKNNEKYIDFQEKMKVLNEIKLEFPNLRKSLYDRIKRYLNYNKAKNKYNLKFILESLPSSLQNNLIIEIYKPIIKNFQFFKSFENSDFFVKIVTSLKPILSMKDDILINEGDIIEDIIFIKTGVLTLEIIIDLDDTKNSVEKHLELTAMDCFKSISNQKFTELINLNSMNTGFRPDFTKQVFRDNYENKKELKIIELRKNEHFGDILMILNEKSPVAVKVKSKKAELFFLQKTEATEISNRYSNIWKRIVNRSLHNMKQIKNLIRKKVFIYTETNNIEIDKELREKYFFQDSITSNINNRIKKQKSQKIIETIIEEEDTNINTQTEATNIVNKNLSTKEQTLFNEIGEIVETKITKENRSIISGKKIKRVNFKESDLSNNKKAKINTEIKKNLNEVNDVISLLDKKIKNSSKNNKMNTFNINIYTPKVQFPLNQINIENKTSNVYNINGKEKDELNNSCNSENINNEISLSKDFIEDIQDNNILMNNSDENSNIYFAKKMIKEKKDNKDYKNTNASDNFNSIIKLLDQKKIDKKQKNEKSDIKTDDIASIKSVSSDKNKIDNKNKDNINIIKINKYSKLNTSQSTSFSIKSTYENINQISNFKYAKNTNLREKTKKFILDQIESHINEVVIFSNTAKNNNKFLKIKNDMKLNTKNITVRKKSVNLEKSIISNINENKSANIHHNKRSTMQFEQNIFDFQDYESKSVKKTNRNEITPKHENEEKQRGGKRAFSVINANNNDNNNIKTSTISITKKRNPIKKRHIKKHQSNKEKDKTFYNKINKFKTTRKRKENINEEKPDKEQKNNEMNYDKLISKNIEKNQQNLNNPEEYFEGFFNDIILKKHQSNKLKPDVKIKKKNTFDE